ncbi:MAG: DUF1343 domain-containing protein [candidate division KSB1 bacterium]|nr:DUF1343 domain-containing protein [candidate division KSB1 bacterium]MDQ7063468.1 DUF1343 domain-containing protein [candidate division KSB1 bacterium]
MNLQFWMTIRRRIPIFLLLISATGCSRPDNRTVAVLTGADRVAAGEKALLLGKRVGLITNHTGITRDGRHIADVLHEDKQIELAALFGPEHGIRGRAEAGERVESDIDEATGLRVFSLYGRTRKPTPDMLDGLDVLAFDIQDVGTRFYTYISTMSLAMEAAAEKGIPFVVLDRPNPIGGVLVEGPVLDPALRSFVGIHPIPLRHGMTVGELARMFNEEGWLKNGVYAELHVIPMQGWKRSMLYDETGLKWIAPSPNMPKLQTALLYPGMGLLEATNFSEGRGTDRPFERVGAPWLDSEAVIHELRGQFGDEIEFQPVTFVPKDIPGKATNPKFEGETCQGIRFTVRDGHRLQAVKLGFALILALQKHHADVFHIHDPRMHLMSGQRWVAGALKQGATADELISRWQPDVEQFLQLRSKYLLYE